MIGPKRDSHLSQHQVQRIARALADPRRYEILQKLRAQGDSVACTDMRDCINVGAPTLSHHMKELETAGLVRSEKHGKFVDYYLESAVLKAYLERLKSDLV
jgi:ArsR family transcriptional regulator, arsenate/arsenite/antimonite-responsive transcriptional repressor